MDTIDVYFDPHSQHDQTLSLKYVKPLPSSPIALHLPHCLITVFIFRFLSIMAEVRRKGYLN